MLVNRRAWTTRETRRLRELYPTHSYKECAAILGRPLASIHTKLQKLCLRKQTRFCWTAAELRRLRELYPAMATKSVAAWLGRTLESVNGMACKIRTHKSEAYLAGPYLRLLSGLGNDKAHRFPKGHVPANKGLRRPGYAPGRMAETQFKRGQRSANYLPIGALRTDSNGYLRRKITDGLGGFGNGKIWELVHRRVWEDAHGPIPKGFRIWWKDRDRTNCALKNLEMLSGADHMARTTIHRYPMELKKTMRLAGKLKRKIREREDADKNKDTALAGASV